MREARDIVGAEAGAATDLTGPSATTAVTSAQTLPNVTFYYMLNCHSLQRLNCRVLGPISLALLSFKVLRFFSFFVGFLFQVNL